MAIEKKPFYVSSEMCQAAAQTTGRLAYIKDTKGHRKGCEKTLKVVGSQGGIMLATAALGAGGCTGVGALIGLAGGPAAPISVPICAGIGFGVGLVVSAIVGPVIVAELPCADSLSQDYKEWKQEITQTELVTAIQQKYPDDPLFASIQDTITYDFFREPVIAPCGHTLEKQFVLQHLQQNNLRCPSCRVPLDKTQLKTDYLMIGKTRKIFASLLMQETQNPGLSPQITADLYHISQSMDQQAKTCYFRESDALNAQLRENSISAALYKTRMNELMELLD